MEALVRHLVEPIVSHPEDLQLQAVEGEASVVLEMVVHADDRELFEADGNRTLRAIRNVLSAAAGRRKATLDLVEPEAFARAEE